jgi:hypothetical protein
MVMKGADIMVYNISYDLKKEGQKYEELHKAIKGASNNDTWMHYLESTWIIKSYLSSTQIYEKLEPFIDSNDRIIIMEVTKNYYGFLPKDAWPYLKNMFD